MGTLVRMLPRLRRRCGASVLVLLVTCLAVMSCTSAPAQATDPTATATPTPTPVSEEQASQPRSKVESTATPTPTSTPASTLTVTVPQRPDPNATPTPTPKPRLTPTPTPEAAASGPALGNCFGGALSEDPLHCHVLEQADAQGLIDVVGVYDAAGLLYVSIRQEEVATEVYHFTREQSYAFYDAWPDFVPYSKYRKWCDDGIHDEEHFPFCYLGLTGLHEEHILPRPSAYENILFQTGGDAGRRTVPGWASWRQLWPATSDDGKDGAQDGVGVRGDQQTFDVSDVDVINFPWPLCNSTTTPGCSDWIGAAGFHSWGRVGYYQIKNPPTDKAGIAALKKRIDPCHGIIGQCTYTVNGDRRTQTRTSTSTIVFIPVKYDYGELRRWATILDRFALSAGNTIGITDAKVVSNSTRSYAIYLNGMKPTERPELIRETIIVWARDAQRAADALPVLLPLLGIPVNAVGMVEKPWW